MIPQHIPYKRIQNFNECVLTWKSEIADFKSVVKMIRKHEYYIINFFDNLHTNAKAERLNGKINRFLANNFGMKDKDFALYRIANYFS